MIRHRIFSVLLPTAAIAVLLITLPHMNGVATSAPPDAGNQADSAKALLAAVDAQARQLKELQKQVADLQARVSQIQTPRIVAAGTATIKLPGIQDNKQKIRVKLPADIAARLGANCIVQLTNRIPTGGAFFVPYWKPATDGFDIRVADPSLSGDYQIVPNDKEPYYIDWIVVQK
jgi:hypothetical protein